MERGLNTHKQKAQEQFDKARALRAEQHKYEERSDKFMRYAHNDLMNGDVAGWSECIDYSVDDSILGEEKQGEAISAEIDLEKTIKNYAEIEDSLRKAKKHLGK